LPITAAAQTRNMRSEIKTRKSFALYKMREDEVFCIAKAMAAESNVEL
jgi:hypothetical protein